METIEENVVVPIQRTAVDYREAYTWLRWHSPSWPVLIASCVVVAGLFFWFVGTAAAIRFIVLELIFLSASYFITLTSLVKKMQAAHALNGATSYTFTPNGFDYKSERSSSTTSWDVVNRAVETKRSFLLVYANTCFLIIPKACVPAQDLDRLRELIASRVARTSLRKPAS